MRGPDLKPRKLRPAAVRDGLRPSKSTPTSIRRARASQKALSQGLCSKNCGRPLATQCYCRPCADKHAARSRAFRATTMLCARCRKAPPATKTLCRPCADQLAAYSVAYRASKRPYVPSPPVPDRVPVKVPCHS